MPSGCPFRRPDLGYAARKPRSPRSTVSDGLGTICLVRCSGCALSESVPEFTETTMADEAQPKDSPEGDATRRNVEAGAQKEGTPAAAAPPKAQRHGKNS